MRTVFLSFLSALCSCFRSGTCLRLENLALRHQINVLRRRGRRQLHLSNADRLLWVCLSRLWTGWRSALVIIKPETVISWHRKGFRLYWTWKSRHARPGRPDIPREVRDLIRKISLANPLWGAPRIHGELLKLGIELSQATVAKYMVRHRKPPSQTWRTFLNNHARDLVSVDFFTVPTIRFRMLFVFVVLALHRRRVVHFNVTEHPTAAWTARQIVQAFPWDTAPRYLIGDRDSVYGEDFRQRVRAMGIHEVLTAPRSPWQNAYAERLVGSIRRECLDHVMVFNEFSLRRILKLYFDYYQGSRTHLALAKDAPEPRAVQPPEVGAIIELPQVGGLHHLYERRAA
jgi:transposase InsO family protein